MSKILRTFFFTEKHLSQRTSDILLLFTIISSSLSSALLAGNSYFCFLSLNDSLGLGEYTSWSSTVAICGNVSQTKPLEITLKQTLIL